MPKVACHPPRLQVMPYREAQDSKGRAAGHAIEPASRPAPEPPPVGGGLRLLARRVCHVTLLKVTTAAGLAAASYLAAYRAVTPKDTSFEVDHPLRWVPPVAAGVVAFASCRLVEGARAFIEGSAAYAHWTPGGNPALPPLQRWSDRLQRANAQPLEEMALAQTVADLIELRLRHPDVIKPARLAKGIADLGRGALDLRSPAHLQGGLEVLMLAMANLQQSFGVDGSVCVSALRDLGTNLHKHPQWRGLGRAQQQAIDAHIDAVIRTLNERSKTW